jgi:hypothetical protein
MKIKREEISRALSALRISSLMTMAKGTGALFFPIESSAKIEETEKGVVLLETRNQGAASLVKPGLVMLTGDKDEIPSLFLAYATTEYAAPFSISEYHEITGDTGFLSDEQRTMLDQLDCLVVRKDSILVSFELGADMEISDK